MSTSRLNWPAASYKQTAVYWGNPENDGMGGRTFDEPVELSPDDTNGVHWKQRQELFIDANGQEKRSQAVVWLAQDVVNGGYLYLGELADLDSDELADPLTVDDAFEIRAFRKIPSVADATRFERKAWL